MRQIVINELSDEDLVQAKAFLKENARPGGINGMYWLDLPEELLDEAQQGHEQCGPFMFGLELGDDFLSLELLVRSQSNLHCSCTAYATKSQRNFALEYLDNLVQVTNIKA